MKATPRYQLWDKKSTIYTPSGKVFTAQEWLAKHTWAQQPDAKAVISGDDVNGGCMLSLNALVSAAIRRGAVIPDGLTDEEILTAVEAFEDEENAAMLEASKQPSELERIAAAMEYQALYSMDDVTETEA